MTEYKANSHRSKELEANKETNKATPEKRVEKVVSGTVKKRDNKVRRFTDIFISEDAANVKSYIFMDVLVPAFKKAVSDIVTDGIDMILYGGSGGNRSKSRSGSKVSYRSYYDDRRNDRRDNETYSSRSRFDYEDIVFESRGEAEAVLDQMIDLIERYGIVTVADLYEMAGLSIPPYTSNKYGWSNVRNVDVQRIRDGYILKLPKAMLID